MSKFPQVKEQMDLILKGTEEVIPVEELEKKWKAEKKPVTSFFNEILIEAMEND